MPPALKALLAQLAGFAAAIALARSGALGGLWPLVSAQAVVAATVAAGLRSARWWLPIHLGFLPLAVLAQGAGIHPGWYLGGFVTLVLVYWTSFRTQVPLYLSNAATAAAVAKLLPDGPARMLDIGAGTGALLRPLAQARPDCRFTGVELAPATWAIGRLLLRGHANVEWQRGDLFAPDWSGYDLVYAFLSPVPMPAVWAKAIAEMRPGSLLVSNSFEVPGHEADAVIEVGDRRGTRLFLYRMRARRGRRSG
ncbi:class I SAM-dependent methyltransferase [Thauera phenylacetica]